MRSVSVQSASGSYEITIGPGARSGIARLVGAAGVRAFIITDTTVGRLHGRAVLDACGPAATLTAVRPGERSKTLATAGRLYDWLAEARAERTDLVVALGGGVVGDLAGFVAATWMRGVPLVQMPTTMEAALDASVGGKTGVNHPRGKNLVGAFHAPRAVLIDTDLLATLPERDRRAGLAESVKHAAVVDPALLEWQEQNAEAILAGSVTEVAELIARNCEIKAGVVSRDEREHDLRAILNHGHTVGHALEHVLGYKLRHGECVALGMVVENELARARGMLSAADALRVRDLLERLRLPVRLPRAVEAGAVLEASRSDKKSAGGAVRYVLLAGLGAPQRVADVRDEEVTAALRIIAPGAEQAHGAIVGRR